MELNMAKKEELDAKVAKMMNTVKQKRTALGELERPRWTTTCSLELPGFDRINIQVEKDMSLLLIAIGTLRRMRKDIADGETNLQIGNVSITPIWKNFKISDWCDDLCLRIRLLNKQAEQKKLTTLEKQLHPLLSEEQRRELALAAIEEQL